MTSWETGRVGRNPGEVRLLESLTRRCTTPWTFTSAKSWPLAMLWPGLDLVVLADLAAGVDSEDDEERAVVERAQRGARA